MYEVYLKALEKGLILREEKENDMTLQEYVGEKFATAGEGNGKSAWEIIGVLPNDQLKLKPIRYTKKLRYRPLLADRIGFYYGDWHMPAPKFNGDLTW